MAERQYIAIDLKSFYASVECMERGLDPLTTNLVVADASRTEKTICLAVSPSLKAYGIPGRARLFEVVQKVKEENRRRKSRAPGGVLIGESVSAMELAADSSLAAGYITAPPRMAYYMEYSTRIYEIYLKYVAPEDMIVYSIDEVFMDVTNYLKTYGMSSRQLAITIIKDVLETTGITAAGGIGTNLYLAKIAMDIVAKKIPPDKDGVRIAGLNERTYREQLWTHTPLTDFWRVGKGYAGKLEACGIYTMGDVARCSMGKPNEYYNADLLYNMFGVNAELLIDHAWGWEPCTISDIKAYKPSANSICSGQVLQYPYDAEKTRIIVCEMADQLALDLVDKKLVTNQLTLTIGYDIENLKDPEKASSYLGEITVDAYGRKVPKHGHGTIHLDKYTSSARKITEKAAELYDRIDNPRLLVRRVTLNANNLLPEDEIADDIAYEQMDLFTDYKTIENQKKQEQAELERERKIQDAVLELKKKFGKNAVLKGMNLKEGATAISRNGQIGGHKA